MQKKKGRTLAKLAPRPRKRKKSSIRDAKWKEVPARKPRQSRLPGMEDSPIKDLEDAAIEHSQLASEIVATRAKLKDSKTTITTLMKANNKKSYNHNGIRLKLREGHDDVSVQVKRHDHVDTVTSSDDGPSEE